MQARSSNINWFSWLGSASPMGWLSYSFQRVSLAGVYTRLLFLSGVSFINVLIGAGIYRLVSGQTWGTSLYKAYGVLFRAPGIGVFSEETAAAAVVLNVLFLFSLFVFAFLIGMISDEFKQQVHAIRAGEVTLPLRDHIVVLHWNQQALSLLKQLSHAQADSHSRLYKRPIVVLAEPSKSTLDSAVAAVFKGAKHLRLFCRSGRPAKARDLELVAAEAADTVIVLHPDCCSSKSAADALKATALVSLTCLRERVLSGSAHTSTPCSSSTCATVLGCMSAAAHAASKAASSWLKRLGFVQVLGRTSSLALSTNGLHSSSMRIVVQMENSPSCSPQDDVISFLQDATASSLYSGRIQQVQLLSQSTLDRLVCQTAVEPGVATVFRELVRAGGDVRLDWCEVGEQLAGSYGGAAEMLQGCVLLGVLEAEGKQLMLNPPDHLLLQPGDRLVALTRQGMLGSLMVARSVSKQRSVRRTVSRVSSMASPQLGVLTARSSSDGGASSCTSPTKASKDSTAKQGANKGQRIIVLGWAEAAVPELLLQLQETAPKGSTITVVLPAQTSPGGRLQQASAGKQKQQAQQQPGVPQVQYLRVADPSSVQAFLEAGIADADAVMLGSSLSADAAPASTEADALVTSAVLAIQQALQITQQSGLQAGKQAATSSGSSGGWQPRSKLHVVAVVSSYSVRRALQNFLSSVLLHCSFSYEIMLMDEFAAGMLVSVALEVANSLVIDQLLLQPRSAGLSVWSLQKLGLGTDCQPTFMEVSKAARQCKCTALGYLRRADGRMMLVPYPVTTALSAEDRVVVLDGSKRGQHGAWHAVHSSRP